jgi:hypothetical protein
LFPYQIASNSKRVRPQDKSRCWLFQAHLCTRNHIEIIRSKTSLSHGKVTCAGRVVCWERYCPLACALASRITAGIDFLVIGYVYTYRSMEVDSVAEAYLKRILGMNHLFTCFKSQGWRVEFAPAVGYEISSICSLVTPTEAARKYPSV